MICMSLPCMKEEKYKLRMNCVVCQGLNNTEKRYRELKMKVDSLDGETGGLGNINKKAMDIKKEAGELLDEAKEKIKRLEGESSKLLSVLTVISLHGHDSSSFTESQLKHSTIHTNSVYDEHRVIVTYLHFHEK